MVSEKESTLIVVCWCEVQTTVAKEGTEIQVLELGDELGLDDCVARQTQDLTMCVDSASWCSYISLRDWEHRVIKDCCRCHCYCFTFQSMTQSMSLSRSDELLPFMLSGFILLEVIACTPCHSSGALVCDSSLVWKYLFAFAMTFRRLYMDVLSN